MTFDEAFHEAERRWGACAPYSGGHVCEWDPRCKEPLPFRVWRMEGNGSARVLSYAAANSWEAAFAEMDRQEAAGTYIRPQWDLDLDAKRASRKP